MTLDLSMERIGFSLLLLFPVILFLFWSRRRVRIETVPQVELLFACATGLVYGLFQIWVGCGLILPSNFK